MTDRRRKTPLKMTALLILALAMLLMASCGSATTTQPTTATTKTAETTAQTTAGTSATAEITAQTTTESATDATTESTSSAHNDLLRLPVTTNLIATDPHYTAQNADYMLFSVLYDSFYEVDNERNMEPRLATSYDVSEDGLVYTYHLRSGVKWQTGGEFTASDVVYSVKRAQASPYTASYVGAVADVKAVDDLTVEFTLSAINPTFYIDINRVRFLSEAATKDLATGFTDQISGGTGPYKLVTWGPDRKTVITRNPDYYGDPAPIGTIEFILFGDSTAALRAFEAGELDWAMVPSADWARISADTQYKSFLQDTITVIFIAMNNQVAPFDDVRVRQAFNYAVNRDDMLYAALEDTGRVVNSLGNPNLVFGVPDTGEIFEYGYDPEKAKQLLADAGYADGLKLDAPLLTLGGDEFSIPAQVLQEQLAAIGVIVEIQTVEQSAFVTDLIGGNYSLGVMGLSLDIDASMLAMAYTTSGIDALNLARYSNPKVDELFMSASQTIDQDARKAFFNEAFDLASRDAAYLPLYSMQASIATDPDLNSSVYVTYYSWSWN